MLITVRDPVRRAAVREEFRADVERLQRGLDAHRAFETDIYVTNTCNLRCNYCYFYFEDYFAEPSHHARENVSLDTLRALADQLSGHTYCVVVLGGEPFSRRDFGDLLTHMRALDIPSIRVSTNGLLLRRNKHLLPLVDTLTVSIDAMRIRQYPKQMARLLDDLRALRQEFGADLPTVVPSWTTASNDDFDRDVVPLLDFCVENAFIMKFLPLKHDQHSDWAKEREMALRAVEYAGREYVTNDRRHSEQLSDAFTQSNCLVRGNQFYLDFEGNFLYPCDEYADQKVGSLLEHSIDELVARGRERYGEFPVRDSVCAHCPSGCHSDNSYILRHPERQLEWFGE
ncbi:radical SAM protein [Nocardia pseudobrasiliensis]|uniref:MoaA/NifB/PqqE/SkfB family radical SAM enzyme n=1 Tax=Nocardia pseudobrasiliensis TaxID=45979 RepID=A0A370I2P4_9NOCA|nr:radical SAM protein [Nocardia pseudobrasiliensis]RDI65012.1 MoaA/NifB/PqqE/SkfB family radical SAM enzyme [Nocardia pseudobrasiliensis]